MFTRIGHTVLAMIIGGCLWAQTAHAAPSLPDKVVVSREVVEQLMQYVEQVLQENQAQLEEKQYWFGRYKELKQCVLDHPDTATVDCINTI